LIKRKKWPRRSETWPERKGVATQGRRKERLLGKRHDDASLEVGTRLKRRGKEGQVGGVRKEKEQSRVLEGSRVLLRGGGEGGGVLTREEGKKFLLA